MKECKNKYDFIQEILESKKLTVAQRERVLILAKEEFKKDGVDFNRLEERVKSLEENINQDTAQNELNVDNSTSLYDFIPKIYYSSQSLSNYLRAYNNDMLLKSTCHLIDSGEIETINRICGISSYDFTIHYEKIIEHLTILEKRFRTSFIDNKMKALVHIYIKGGGKWNKKIPINWNSEELKVWCNNNKGIPPSLDSSLFEEYKSIGFEFEDIELPIQLLEHTKINTFSGLIQYFKYLYHIRSDNSLKNIFYKINKRWDTKVIFDYSEINEQIELFTNVEKLVETYINIIKLIIDVSKNNTDIPKVKLGFFKKESGDVIFSIHHINSIYKHTIEDAVSRPGQVYKNLINNQINGLCDFYIKADFGGNQFYKINIWNYWVWQNKTFSRTPIDKTEGVKYILNF